MSPSTREDDLDNSRGVERPEPAELLAQLIGCPDRTLVEQRSALFGTGPCTAAMMTSDGRTWWCTRVAGHAGEHIAGTGAYIAFAWVGGDTRW
jgi:hypothetical protein